MVKDDKIKLGYEVKTGNEVYINPSHLIVTGVSQLSGKTTTLEALIKRSKLKAVVFKTKIGEKSFSEGVEIPPFFRDRSDYEFVKSLIEAYAKEKLFLEKGTLMRLCKGSVSLLDIKKRVDDELASEKLRGLKEEIHTRLQHYLENLIPQIQYANLSKTLDLREGVNIMNLERFSEEAQSLIIQSVADEVLKNMKGVILVIPEAWKFLPQKYNNPCKRVVESFIRQGATNKNFIFIDSQEMAGTDKSVLKQVSSWILGLQMEKNEVKHTLDQISLPKKSKPKEEDIMNLRKGHFFLSDYDGVKQVYVQPNWLSDEDAIKIAMGELDVGDLEAPVSLSPISRVIERQSLNDLRGGEVDASDIKKIRRELIELRGDFFNKIQELQVFEQKLAEQIYNLKSLHKDVDVDELVSKVLQKIPATNNSIADRDSIVKDVFSQVLAKIPRGGGSTVYEVAPLEKIKKDFLEETKNRILSQISELNDKEKRMLKFLESQGKETKAKDIITKGWNLAESGSASTQVGQCGKTLINFEFVKKGTHGGWLSVLKDKLLAYLSIHQADEQEIEQVYNYILMELLK